MRVSGDLPGLSRVKNQISRDGVRIRDIDRDINFHKKIISYCFLSIFINIIAT